METIGKCDGAYQAIRKCDGLAVARADGGREQHKRRRGIFVDNLGPGKIFGGSERVFAPRDTRLAPATGASIIAEDTEEDDDDAPDPTIRDAARPLADTRPALGHADALALDLENVRRLNVRLRA
jgi:hypothetical protein